MDLHLREREQEQEISVLRRQIAQSHIKEMQLLNEKYAAERKFSEIRLAMDEKKKESITSALKELAQRKGDIDENLRLVNYLKDVEDDRYILMTSLLGLLAEYGISPSVVNASSISVCVKRLYEQLQWKIRAFHVSADIASLLLIAYLTIMEDKIWNDVTMEAGVASINIKIDLKYRWFGM